MTIANTVPFDENREIAASNWEDVRRRLWLVEHPWAGNVAESGLFTAANWAGSWGGYASPDDAQPGDIIVRFQGADGNIDYYVNWISMSEAILDDRPPLRSDGSLNSGWRLAPDPNRYHSFDHNAGNPAIGADGRWQVIHNPENETCIHFEYTLKERAYKWLPRQVDPYRQIPPLKSLATGRITMRHQPVELQKVFIARNLAPTHERSLDVSGYEQCKHPRRLTEYVFEFGEPQWVGDPSGDCIESNQCASDPKMNEAYQDRVIRTCEVEGSHYLKKVDEEWIENWLSVQTKYLWALATYYAVGKIVYKVSETDTVQYVCYTTHTSDADKEPGVGVDWEDYWATPAYNPTYLDSQPVYTALNGNPNTTPQTCHTWLWGCNDSAYELLLKSLGGIESVYPDWSADHGAYCVDDVVRAGDICRRCKRGHDSAADKDPTNGEYWEAVTQFDWWWDTSHPAVPIWLYKYQYDADPVDWPLPRGCWRRTWKHSAGRLGAIMWPGEKGDPPGYEGLKLIVSQSDYNAMPEGNRKWYAVSDVEGLHAAAYGDEEEALIAKRHDPAHIRWIQYLDEDLGEMVWVGHPVYELHHDLLNDLRNVLLQLRLVDDNGLTIQIIMQEWTCSALTGPDCRDLYLHCIDTAEKREGANPVETVLGASGGVEAGYHISVTWSGLGYWVGTLDATLFIITVQYASDLTQSILIGRPLIRVGYRGTGHHAAPWAFDGCIVGFEDLTVFAVPRESGEDGPERYEYVRLDLGEEIVAGWWDFTAELVSPWPDTAEGGYFDVPPDSAARLWDRETQLSLSTAAHQWCVFEYDFNKIPEAVWDEYVTNAIDGP